ncbi:MAG: hypothetical protein MJ126_00305 [Lachnospiraceae bacterium]|nr:hypothetical protein [Lachnospiraceae bacterium]
MNKELIVGDFLFENMEDANEARLEQEKIDKLTEKLKNSDADLLYKVYNKSLEKKTFKTPIGYNYLSEMKRVLDYSDMELEVLPIPVVSNEVYIKPVVKEENTKSKNSANKYLIITIIILVFVIISMFIILGTSDKPVIINYENKILDKYSSWEQDLTEREKQINLKEKELGLK